MLERVPRCFVEKVYDRLYDEAQKLFDEYSPPVCGDFEFGICNARVHSIDSETLYRIEKEIEEGIRPSLCCCERCRHLTNKGCKTRNLYCKLFLCRYQESRYPDLHLKLTTIHNKCFQLGFQFQYFVDKDLILDDTMHKINSSNHFTDIWLKMMEEENGCEPMIMIKYNG